MAKRSLTRGDRNIAWIERYCIVPEGRLIGQPVKLRPWQRRIIRGIYDKPTRRAIISFGRKNGKTALAAFLLLLHLVGPEARPNSQLFSAAQSRDQAALLFGLAAKMVRLSPELSQFIVIRDTNKQLFCGELGTLYRALSAEASTAYGLSPVFIVHDELGQVKGPRSELYEALETATAAQEDPLSIIISTQARTDSDLLSMLIDDAKTEADPKMRLFIYSADPESSPFTKKAMRAANPAFGDFQNADEVVDMAAAASRVPTREAEFRNLILNQRVEGSNPFITPSVWDSNKAAPADDWDGMDIFAGLDLSATNDLTALVLVGYDGSSFHVRPTFWLPGEGLAERARNDRVPYDLWKRQGHLNTTPGKSVEYEFVADHLAELLNTMDIRTVAFDRWGMKYLVPWLLKAGIPEEVIEEQFEDFGQGYQSMSPALRDLESALLNGKIRHGGHPILRMCSANAVVARNEADGRKLDKKKSNGRIDGMVALAMAVGVASQYIGEDGPSVYAQPGFFM